MFILAFKKEDKGPKKSVFDEFNFLDETESKNVHFLDDMALKAPILFTRPRPEDFKEMMRTYFEIKKII